MLLTVLATLPFLAAFAVATLVLSAELAANRNKITAALRGESLLAVELVTRPVTVKFNHRPVQSRVVARVEPRWRVAA